MKVKRLRLVGGCYALQMKDNICADKDTSIELLGGGNFLVKYKDGLVFIPNHQVHFAVCEPDDKKK